MRHILFVAVLNGCSFAALADPCRFELNGNLQLENNQLQVSLNNDSLMQISSEKRLKIDGQIITLSAEQQIWVDQYYEGIYGAVTEAADLATDALGLVSVPLKQAFTELLGSDNQSLAELSDKLQQFDQQQQYNFYAEDGQIRLNSAAIAQGAFFGEQWQQQFRGEVQEMLTESVGKVMLALGAELIFGDGDMHEFEQKMQKFARQIEQSLHAQSAAIKKKAQALCISLVKIDRAERQLQGNIRQLRTLDIIQVTPLPQAM
jgi:hypothetical protein